MDHKMINGSVAGATGIVLLLGGFGTYALWTDSESTPSSTINSGVLDIAAGAALWEDASPDATSTSWTPGTDLVVPGDVIEQTQTFTVSGTGKNLAGEVTFDEGALTSAFGAYLTVDVVVTSDNAGVVNTSGNDFAFSDPFGTADLTAVVTYTFDSATPDQVAQNASAALAASTLTISQTR